MIVGTGIDIVDVERIRSSIARYGERFTRRILVDAELAYCLAHRDPAPLVAARFAAKEAISKALGTGIGGSLSWHDMEIARLPSGEPKALLRPTAAALLELRGGNRLHITLSHTAQHATAMAIAEWAGELRAG